MRSGLICGSELPGECHAKNNTIYSCDGQGARPVELSECKPGTECIPRDGTPGATCGSKKCDCYGNNTVCSESFPESCGLDKNSVYRCTLSGRAEKVQDCEKGQCVQLADGAVCRDDKCKCPVDGDVCGVIFPLDCKIPTGNIYTCVKGEDPVLKEECPVGCIGTVRDFVRRISAKSAFEVTEVMDKCTKDPCKCQEKGDVCGSTFPEECKFPKDNLYECSGDGATPAEKLTCSNKGCVITTGDDVCSSCLCLDGTPTCGSVFGPECKKDNSTLYTCSRVDALPSNPTKCAWGCDVKDGPDNCNADCLCKDNNDICGSQFPTKCNYDLDSLYKCSGNGNLPSSPEDCSYGPCLVLDGDDKCTPDPCLCKEAKKVVCGKSFLDVCLLDEGMLYECPSAGATPKPIEKCEVGCEEREGDSNDVCKDPCVCTTSSKKKICGSELPKDCKADKNMVYHCPSGEGSKPLIIGHCKPGLECIREEESDDASCGSNNCECNGDKEVCSDSFPNKCRLDPNTIYKCTPRGKHLK
ncbi:hypothetical protein BGZ83_003573, partial [Gryganskiella cystojenkinii]